MGKKLVNVSHRKGVDYRFYILNSKHINAMAVPGGYIYITKGMLEKLDNEAQLAAVLGHEIAHVYWEKTSNYMNMLDTYLDGLDKKGKPSLGNIPHKILMKEAVLESFLPKGVLAEKYFGIPVEEKEKIKVKEKRLSDWRIFSRNNLKNLANKYLNEGRKLDENFLNEVNKLLINFV